MAESMQDIKRRMRSIESTQHITNAMRLVSAAKFRKAKSIFDKTNLHLGRVIDMMEELLASVPSLPEQYAYQKEKAYKRTAYILITSSKGLCGGFNNNLLKALTEEMHNNEAENGAQKEDATIYAVGLRGRDHFQRLGYRIAGEYTEAPEKITFREAKEIAGPILECYQNGEVDQVVIIYTNYVNSLKQEPVVKRMLPMEPIEKDARGGLIELEYVPSSEDIIAYLIPKYFEIMLFQAVIESATCEHAARRTAMENATDNAKDMLNSLSLTYNRARQQAITDELIEIVAGSEAQH